ncbi:type III-B CRISPR-associated protein Cas10/Cmr2 [Ktedonospora formicarum]|uniref:Type III-B CRISPR-associated protein Cas10/Cmr2 n=1 Tax=Ktedonospora formicarum TaxID=2778364 RepID=A0A8J3IE70_9CHLR|nr:type III-B CRISPR-associated protein Cas10/Cmr2 [Ktedonospora formicarum]GHO49659.1 type III-B CRISPR-associated protein Cas10/Cmr2 [Ktedonospora formicarum]
MAYLFEASIGPVQDFIASARRTRDLYTGSWLLSELSKAAALAIVRAPGNSLETLIFPAPAREDDLIAGSTLSVANKIVARIQGSPREMGSIVKLAIGNRLKEIASKALTFPGEASLLYELAHRQVDELVEYSWVAIPFEDESEYPVVRKDLEALLAARKNTRNFTAVSFDDKKHGSQPKSSLTGQLESVIPWEMYPQSKDAREGRLQKTLKLYTIYGAGPAERLSGVDLLKRRGGPADASHYPSNSHISAIPYLLRLEKLTVLERAEAEKEWTTYLNLVRDAAKSGNKDQNTDIQETSEVLETVYGYYRGRGQPIAEPPILREHDGSLLFEERLLYSIDKSQFAQIQTALTRFFHKVNSVLGSNVSPSPYYAILVADGDGMGEVIDHQAHLGIDKHRQLSRALALFSGGVRETVRKHRGALIYAGGDDVMALLPLHSMLACVQELAENYQTAMRLFKNEQGKQSTLSAGVAIVHHLALWQEALDVARDAESRAKRVPGKNAIAITLQRRSGESYQIAGPREILLDRSDSETLQELPEVLEQLIAYQLADDLPRGIAYELRALRERLSLRVHHEEMSDKNMASQQKDELKPDLEQVLRTDSERILKRKLVMRHGKVRAQELLIPLLEVAGLRDSKLNKVSDAEHSETRPDFYKRSEQFINALIISQALADARELAEGPRKVEERSR